MTALSFDHAVAQTVKISGFVKGAVKDTAIAEVKVLYFDRENKLALGDKTDREGDFEIDPRTEKGETIKLVFRHKKYKEKKIDYTVKDPKRYKNIIDVKMIPLSPDSVGSATPVIEEEKTIIISGFVKDKSTGKTITDVKVRYFSLENQLILGDKSDEDGYFEIDPKVGKRPTIKLIFTHPRFKGESVDYPIKDPEYYESIVDVQLAPLPPDSVAISGQIYNGKKKEKGTLEQFDGVRVNIINLTRNNKSGQIETDRDGHFILYIEGELGDLLEINFNGKKVQHEKRSHTVGHAGDNYLGDIYLQPAKPRLEKILLIGGGAGAGVFAVVAKVVSDNKYESYKNAYSFSSNDARQNTLKQANNLRDWSLLRLWAA